MRIYHFLCHGAVTESKRAQEERNRITKQMEMLLEFAGHEWEQHFILPDGSLVIANGAFTMIRDAAGNTQYLLNTIKDISDRKQAGADLLAAKEEAAWPYYLSQETGSEQPQS